MKYFPKISRGNVYLSPLHLDDYEILTKWMNDSRITDFIPMGSKIATIQGEKAWLENINKNGDYTFAIVKKDGDQFIGTIALHSVDYVNQSAVLGIMIGDVKEHSKGYGSNAINALLSYAFNTLNLYNINLRVRSFNEKAIACYTKCGFKKVGAKHHCIYHNGKWYNHILMEILKPSWQKKNK